MRMKKKPDLSSMSTLILTHVHGSGKLTTKFALVDNIKHACV